MAVRDDWAAGEVLTADDLNQTFASKVDYSLAANAQSGTTYTFVLADASRLTTATSSSAKTFTIPPQSAVTWPANSIIRVVNYGAGALTVNGGSGVTVTNTATTIGQYQSAAAIRTGSDAWTLIPFAGGGVDLSTNLNLVSFTASGSTTVPSWATAMKYLVVGGGQASASANETGGAGGQVVQGSVAVAGGTTLTITVGGSGGNSSLAVSGGSTYTATAAGGASGGTDAGNGSNGTLPNAPFNQLRYGAGGGSGGTFSNCPTRGGEGGDSGGGAGGAGTTGALGQTGFNGRPNTGGGGGGGGRGSTWGTRGNGGSGVVMLYFS